MESTHDLAAKKHMWEELNNIGVRSLRTPAEVDEAFERNKGTIFLVINSDCACAAGHARPGIKLALQHKVIPDILVTVFAGVDREATERAREYLPGFAPSSPSVALFKDGKLVYMLHRRQIESLDAQGVASELVRVFDAFCKTPGPSTPKEKIRA